MLFVTSFLDGWRTISARNYKTLMSYLILRCNLSLSMPTSMGISENTLRDFSTLLGKESKASVAESVCYWGRGTCGNKRPKDYIYEGKNADLGWLVSSSGGDSVTVTPTPLWIMGGRQFLWLEFSTPLVTKYSRLSSISWSCCKVLAVKSCNLMISCCRRLHRLTSVFL